MGTMHKRGTFRQAVRDIVRRCGITPSSRGGRKLRHALTVFYTNLPRDAHVDLAVVVEHSPSCDDMRATRATCVCVCDPEISISNANQPEVAH